MSRPSPLPAKAAVSVSSSVEVCRCQPVAREQRGQAQGETLIVEEPRREIDRNVEPPALVDLRGGGHGFLEHEVGQLADAVVLLGGGHEFGRGNRALIRVGPARQRFRPDDLASREIEFRLVGDPDFAAIDRLIELAQNG